MFAYDAVAPSFDRHRALPDGVPEAIRAAVLASVDVPSRPRLLDVGAGSGRIGQPFVAAGDDYVSVDLSLGMLREFARRRGGGVDGGGPRPRLVHADGRCLPFPEATFDAVMMVQVVGAARDWRRLVSEARRVLQSPGGVLAVGRSLMPPGGLDGRMKRRLASILDRMRVPPYHMEERGDARAWLEFLDRSDGWLVAAEWDIRRTPRDFLSRQWTGARFSALPEPVKEEALRMLGTWATETFGSLDAAFSERHGFELRFFRHGAGL